MGIWQRIRRFIRSFPYLSRRTRIKAVHEDDLLGLLTSLGMVTGVQRGEYECRCCKRIVTMDNLWGILAEDGSIHVICSDPECISRLD
jgi:hypothetical protein